MGHVVVTLALSLFVDLPRVVLASPPEVTTAIDAAISDPAQDAMPPNCNTQSEVSLAAAGNVVVAGWNDMGGQCVDSVLPAHGASTVGFGYSGDGGSTWTDGGLLPAISGEMPGSLIGDPALAAGPDGTIYVASIGEAPNDPIMRRSLIAISRSQDGGRSWSEPVDAGPRYGTGLLDRPSQDKPWIAVDGTSSPYRGNVYAVWTEWRDGVGAVIFSRSTDGGRTFEARQLPTFPVMAASQVAVGPDGEVYLVWLGMTNNVASFARSVDGGKTFDLVKNSLTNLKGIGRSDDTCVPDRVAGETPVLKGQIRVANFPSLAVDTSGSADPEDPDHNPYRGRIYIAAPSDPDPDFNPGDADITFLYSADRGHTWVGTTTRPTRFIDDDPGRNDQWHPQVAVDSTGIVAVTWYDRRLSADNWDIDVFGRVSTDGGQTFSPSFRVTDRSFPPAVTNPHSGFMGGCYMGDYNGLVAAGKGRFVAAWGDNRNFLVGADLPDDRASLPDPDVYRDIITVSVPGSTLP